jgi:hypothetical protein
MCIHYVDNILAFLTETIYSFFFMIGRSVVLCNFAVSLKLYKEVKITAKRRMMRVNKECPFKVCHVFNLWA